MAIMHEDSKCKKAYKLYKDNGILSAKIIKNLNYIYSNNKQNPKINVEKFKIAFKPLSRLQKIYYRIAICFTLIFVVCFAGSYMFLNSTVGFGTALNPYKVYMQSQLISAIKSNSHIVLTKNITLTEDVSEHVFTGGIDGDGHSLFIENVSTQLLKENKGTIKNINIYYGEIEKIINANFSLLVDSNGGKLDNITMFCDKLSIKCDKSMADMYISGFANINEGTINNCSIGIVSNINTEGSGDCYISGIAGKNSGTISGCQIKENSAIKTFEADISGICGNNEQTGKITVCHNYASLSQSSSADEWSPNVTGI